MKTNRQIFPSLISGDVLNLENQIKTLEPYCDGFHVDVMDWHFVPNLAFGTAHINAISRCTAKPLFIHLMIENSLSFIKLLYIRSNDIIAFHLEEKNDTFNEINAIKKAGCKVAIAINPKTNLEKVFPYAGLVDAILLMSVEPGFSGQQFIADAIDRLKQLNEYRIHNKLNFIIVMDGGINQDNIQVLATHGAQQFAVASALFDDANPVEALKRLHALV